MENTGFISTSISMQVDLWNEIQKVISNKNMSFSRFVQSASMMKIKAMRIQDVREIFDILDEKEIELLHKELIKRQKKTGN